MGKEKNVDADQWIPTGLQTISTHQYRDGDRLVTKQRIVEEFETNVQPYYKNPQRMANLEESDIALRGMGMNRVGGVINETYLHDDDNNRLASFRANNPATTSTSNNTILNESKRIKL